MSCDVLDKQVSLERSGLNHAVQSGVYHVVSRLLVRHYACKFTTNKLYELRISSFFFVRLCNVGRVTVIGFLSVPSHVCNLSHKLIAAFVNVRGKLFKWCVLVIRKLMAVKAFIVGTGWVIGTRILLTRLCRVGFVRRIFAGWLLVGTDLQLIVSRTAGSGNSGLGFLVTQHLEILTIKLAVIVHIQLVLIAFQAISVFTALDAVGRHCSVTRQTSKNVACGFGGCSAVNANSTLILFDILIVLGAAGTFLCSFGTVINILYGM